MFRSGTSSAITLFSILAFASNVNGLVIGSSGVLNALSQSAGSSQSSTSCSSSIQIESRVQSLAQSSTSITSQPISLASGTASAVLESTKPLATSQPLAGIPSATSLTLPSESSTGDLPGDPVPGDPFPSGGPDTTVPKFLSSVSAMTPSKPTEEAQGSKPAPKSASPAQSIPSSTPLNIASSPVQQQSQTPVLGSPSPPIETQQYQPSNGGGGDGGTGGGGPQPTVPEALTTAAAMVPNKPSEGSSSAGGYSPANGGGGSESGSGSSGGASNSGSSSGGSQSGNSGGSSSGGSSSGGSSGPPGTSGSGSSGGSSSGGSSSGGSSNSGSSSSGSGSGNSGSSSGGSSGTSGTSGSGSSGGSSSGGSPSGSSTGAGSGTSGPSKSGNEAQGSSSQGELGSSTLNGGQQGSLAQAQVQASPVLAVGSSTYAYKVDGSSNLVIGSQTAHAGGPAITVGGVQVGLAQDANNIIVAGSTVPVQTPAPTFSPITVGNQVFTPSPTGFSAAGTSLTPGGPGITIAGTVVSLPSSGGQLIVGSSTIALASPTPMLSPITVGNQVIRPAATGMVIAGQTLVPGGPAITVSGTVLSLQPSGTALVVGGSTIGLQDAKQTSSPTFTIDGQIITPNRDGKYVVDSQTITPGAPAVTISGVPISIPGVVPQSGIMTLAGSNALSYSLDSVGNFILASQTLVKGGAPITIGGETVSEAADGSNVVIVSGGKTTTEAMSQVVAATALPTFSAGFSSFAYASNSSTITGSGSAAASATNPPVPTVNAIQSVHVTGGKTSGARREIGLLAGRWGFIGWGAVLVAYTALC